MLYKYKAYIIALFVVLAFISMYFVTTLKFSFSFDQFFPKGDEDLEYYRQYAKEFGTDDGYILIAVKNKPSVYDSLFLARFHDLTLAVRDVPHILKSQSLTTIKNPTKTPFGITLTPVLHYDEPNNYDQDSAIIATDTRFKYNLIDSAGTSVTIVARTIEDIGIEASRQLVDSLERVIDRYGFTTSSHILGRAYFQKEIVAYQKVEMQKAFAISGFLVTFILGLIYRKWRGIVIAMTSILLGLLIFLGYLGALGVELTVLSALYPIIMLIIGCSDVIHIFTKYTDELHRGHDKETAMNITIKEIGLATFITAFTTAIGFASLYTSRLETIQIFGLQAAIGVMIAFFTVILFTSSCLLYFDSDQILKKSSESSIWVKWINKVDYITRNKTKWIYAVTALCLVIFGIGMSKISTNYNIGENLPTGTKVTNDFKYFERDFAGFRPLDFAITIKNPKYTTDDYDVMYAVSKIEDYVTSNSEAKSVVSLATYYKSINKMEHGQRDSFYVFPDSLEFESANLVLNKMPKSEISGFTNESKSKTRISCRLSDIGAQNIKANGAKIDTWINQHIDTSLLEVRRTGTGLILDKNSEYVTKNLMQGLIFSVLQIGLLMGLLFRSSRMLVLALIPNFIPLLFTAALLGFLSIELEAGVAIIFSIVFGIAVDDTIHFLTRYKLFLKEGYDGPTSVTMTLHETGKAIIIASVILFAGFFTLVFSTHPPTFTVGVLIAVTILSALLSELFLLPVLLNKFMKIKPRDKP